MTDKVIERQQRIENYCKNCDEKYTYARKRAKANRWLKDYCCYECYLMDTEEDEDE